MFGQNLRLGSPWPPGDNPWLVSGSPLRCCRRGKEATELLGFNASQGADGGRGRAAEDLRRNRQRQGGKTSRVEGC